jgi:hypothetical protein
VTPFDRLRANGEGEPPPAEPLRSGVLADLERHWIALALVAWGAVAGFFLWQRWPQVRWLALGDTDDNMRLMQVRGLLGGQGWFDLRQHRMNPPVGLDIHWSRLVDLPIAGLELALRPFAGPVWAERLACGIAPLLPLAVAFVAAAAIVRRLVDSRAWPLAIVLLLCATMMLGMFMPMRIDHHGWQLACLGVTVAGLCDRRPGRGGVLVGVATAASLTIGLELLPYAAIAGVVTALRWVWDRGDAPRLGAYGASLGGGSALGFLVFASEANRVLRCDALTPVWLATTVVAGALLVALAWTSPARREVRLVLAVAAGAAVAALFAIAFPQCLGRPEQVSPELARTWLDNVREAKPIYKHPFNLGFPLAALPVIGLIGAAVATWRARRDDRVVGWAAVLAMGAFAAAMLLWQVRAGPAAQLLAVPGATALAWIVFPWLLRSPHLLVRVFGTVGAFLLVSGLFTGIVLRWLPDGETKPAIRRVNRSTARCMSLPSLAQLNRLPRTTVFTFVDFGPRLIVGTHHDAIAGPYHRNGAAILDVQHAFSGKPEAARAIMRRHGATLLVVCPNMAESTIYRARNPGGFYDRLAHAERFAWLRPVAMPRRSPYRVWRIL